jgi:CrcB protein
MTWILVGAGGAVGAMMRHGVTALTNRAIGPPMPFATAIVNIVGCFVMGLLAGALASGGVKMTNDVRSFVFVGVLGGFTTFSAFGLDTMTLVGEGRIGHAVLNVLAQVGLGLGGAFAGYALAHAK